MNKIQILVSSINVIHATDRREIGRFFDVQPVPGRRLVPGTVAEFIAMDGGKRSGMLVKDVSGHIVLDAFGGR